MAVQRVAPAGRTAAVEYRDRPAIRRQPVPAARGKTSIAEHIEQLANDYQRAVFCRQQAEGSRRRWFAGSQQELAYVVARAGAGDPRFRDMTSAQLETTARWRWSQSSPGQYLMEMENMFTNWAQMYLSFAEVEALNRHGVPPG
jgi:hypothetical protein